MQHRPLAWSSVGIALGLMTSCAGRTDRPQTAPPYEEPQDFDDAQEIEDVDEPDVAEPGDEGVPRGPEAGAPEEAGEPTPPTDQEGDKGPDPLAALAGEYQYAGGANQRGSVKHAINSVVEEMNLLVRNIARRRLADANDVPRRISIQPDGEQLTVTIDGRTYTASVGGPSVSVRNTEGGISRMRFRVRNGNLYQVFDADDGDRINAFVPRADGNGMTMVVTMKSSRLPRDIRYRLSYR